MRPARRGVDRYNDIWSGCETDNEAPLYGSELPLLCFSILLLYTSFKSDQSEGVGRGVSSLTTLRRWEEAFLSLPLVETSLLHLPLTSLASLSIYTTDQGITSSSKRKKRETIIHVPSSLES